MRYPYHGIVEGFYGRPWTHDERLDMFAFMAAHGLNGYIYAPKDDALHRDNWRAPYDGDALARFKALADAARAHGIRFTFAVSPGLDLRYSAPDDLETLTAKLQPLCDLGISSFGIFFDDVPTELTHPADRARYRDLGEAQADFLARVQIRCANLHLMTVPTFYCGEPDIPYLHALGAMPPEIDIMWTGPAICSHALTGAHMQAVADVLRRPALVWDNYPVNDAAMVADLHIGPYRNRDAALPVRGIYVNPMSLVQASKLPLATFARYCADTRAYVPEAAWQDAADDLLGPELAAHLAVFAEAVTTSPLTPEEPPAMAALVAPFYENRLPYTPNPAPDHLRAGVVRMRTAQRALMAAVAGNPIVADMEPWLRDYARWIDLLEAASRYVDARMVHHTDDGVSSATAHLALEEIRAGLKEAVDFRTSTCGYVIPNFLQRILRLTRDV
ncbi:MAG: beta-N-acetylglucosaminidase domain-containing protein [Caldilineaceae bacterium]|nr:beta-N-acetylglucosaminidase domain-containing protein [Caldilineaceae bacterium]